MARRRYNLTPRSIAGLEQWQSTISDLTLEDLDFLSKEEFHCSSSAFQRHGVFVNRSVETGKRGNKYPTARRLTSTDGRRTARWRSTRSSPTCVAAARENVPQEKKKRRHCDVRGAKKVRNAEEDKSPRRAGGYVDTRERSMGEWRPLERGWGDLGQARGKPSALFFEQCAPMLRRRSLAASAGGSSKTGADWSAALHASHWLCAGLPASGHVLAVRAHLPPYASLTLPLTLAARLYW